MPVLRIEHAVVDFDRWKQLFDRDPVDRKGGGVRRYRVLRSAEDADVVAIDLEFDSAAEAENFRKRLEALWAGPAAAITRDPRARIWDVAESSEV